MQMTPEQKSKCHTIIHTAAVAGGVGNLSPLPGTGLAADAVALTGMAVALAAVFGGDLSDEAARALAFATLKNTALKQPIKVLTKELARIIPIAGQLVTPAISAGLIEAAGWSMAQDLANRQLIFRRN